MNIYKLLSVFILSALGSGSLYGEGVRDITVSYFRSLLWSNYFIQSGNVQHNFTFAIDAGNTSERMLVPLPKGMEEEILFHPEKDVPDRYTSFSHLPKEYRLNMCMYVTGVRFVSVGNYLLSYSVVAVFQDGNVEHVAQGVWKVAIEDGEWKFYGREEW